MFVPHRINLATNRPGRALIVFGNSSNGMPYRKQLVMELHDEVAHLAKWGGAGWTEPASSQSRAAPGGVMNREGQTLKAL